MSDWTAGYVADIGYTFGYYAELNPQRMALPFAQAGLEFPEVKNACELGFGQGVSVNINAAASGAHWFGTDFNPSQAAFAQSLASASGSQAQLGDEAFAEFCARTDLPDFDFIGLHGIWSWISDANRAVIVDFVRRKLRVGGVLYVSYNTQPGWAAAVPLRTLLTDHVRRMGVSGQGQAQKIDASLAFTQKLFELNPGYLVANPKVADRLKALQGQSRNYLAHEYFNQDWHPMSFGQMATWLDDAKLSYACSANILDLVPAINLTNDQLAFLAAIPDAIFRESVRDYVVNQQFRRDYWVKGPRRLSAVAQVEHWSNLKVLLITPRQDVDLKAIGSLGEAKLNDDVYKPVLDLLADHKPKTVGQLEAALGKALNRSQLWQAITILAGKNDLMLVQDEQNQSKAKAGTEKLNRHLVSRACSYAEVDYLASPVCGGGIAVPRLSQLFIQSRLTGGKTAEAAAKFAWQVISGQGQQVIREGKALVSAEDNLAELNRLAVEFTEKRRPVLKALGIEC